MELINKLIDLKSFLLGITPPKNTFELIEELDEAIALLEKPMHDYAGHSDAVEFAEWIKENGFVRFNDKMWGTGSNPYYSGCVYTTQELYQAFLNREEK
jgi:hypothetical protein